MHTTDLDETDQQPTWTCPPGEELLPGFSAVERLGVGHRCETWLAWSTHWWHPVVVKLARPGQVAHPRARQTLRREIAALTGQPHPSLPRLLGDHTAADVPAIVLEYVDGPSLADIVDEEGPLAPPSVALLGTALVPQVAALHARGLAHLDLKPENVMLRDARPVLVDFGSARPLGHAQPPGKPVGTWGYAAPEMEACEPVSVPMDLFGLGAVLAEALTGAPFPDRAPLPEVPLSDVVRRLLDPDPQARGEVHRLLLDLSLVAGVDRAWPEWLDDRLRAALTPRRAEAALAR